ncbi:MAG: NUDIX domain-containing protein [Helicobacteraceae bacterium]|nr:NUDIX domain-containing protein [Helicobacteraceae bacterium]
MMKNITDVELVECEESRFVKLKQMNYVQDGVAKRWELAQVHDSVAILIYHKDRDSFVVVKQFRPPIYLKNRDGYTYELCAGIIDKECSLEQIAIEEVEEECGFRVSSLERITSFFSAVGFAGAQQTLYYVEVSDKNKVSNGGGIENESIEVIYLPTSKAKEFIFDETKGKTPGIMFGFSWWFEYKS